MPPPSQTSSPIVIGFASSSPPPQGRLRWMGGCVEVDAGTEKDVVPDLDRGTVEEDAAGVGVKALADGDVRSVVAVEGRLDDRVLMDPPE